MQIGFETLIMIDMHSKSVLPQNTLSLKLIK